MTIIHKNNAQYLESVVLVDCTFALAYTNNGKPKKCLRLTNGGGVSEASSLVKPAMLLEVEDRLSFIDGVRPDWVGPIWLPLSLLLYGALRHWAMKLLFALT